MKNTWIELNMESLRANLRSMKESLRPGAELVFVVKSNGYGHGMVPISRCAWDSGIRWLAVTHFEEAVELRKAIPDVKILVLGVIQPEDVSEAIKLRITPIIVSKEHAVQLAERASTDGGTLRCHAKIDTGMGRLGFMWETAGAELLDVAEQGNLKIDGICTHFASAAGTPDKFAETQWGRFQSVIGELDRSGLQMSFKHASNSAAFAKHAEWDLDGIRSGILLYGYGSKGSDTRVNTVPILNWKTRVVQVKAVPANFRVSYYSTYTTPMPTSIAVLNVGYVDGYSRLLSNRGQVLIRGRRMPVVGAVTMNFICVDVGRDSDVVAGDEAALIGDQGEESISASELAKNCRTIPYEILTSIRTDDRRVL